MSRFSILFLFLMALVSFDAFGDDYELDSTAVDTDYAFRYTNEYDLNKEEAFDDVQSALSRAVEGAGEAEFQSDDFAIRADHEDAPALPE